ncbi:hypothetical protein GS624_15225 [Ruegeria sp. HKCCD5849]|uniref:hypothetical protein n=1 Tax=unclassified Ruegeria TaxID=2625375 RepID=UPI00148877BE|nr:MULTISPECIES: hypothetical protein [unclassified Ruegeria]NOD48665.1 hypothetical protein [Ruegeria sp. HKCCD5849]NOD52033.1 hypothetical protein [Ruegeria sp. HKCCD5851]
MLKGISKRTTIGVLVAVAAVIGVGVTWFILYGPGTWTGNISNRKLSDTTANASLPRQANGQSANLLSAFHGLDALPRLSNVICKGSKGYSGMPVIFSTEIDVATMQAGDFQVRTRSGEIGIMHCVSVLPATDPGELRTVLLIGRLGPSDTDPPVSVEIVGHLHSIDGSMDFRGASTPVIPLEDGPSIAWAEVVEDWTLVGTLGPPRVRGSLCQTEGIVQAVRVVWEGGVTLEDGTEPGEAERDLYAITVEAADGTRREVKPAELANLGDGDNNHMLCMDTKDQPISVSFPEGILTDPNGDLNPVTKVAITPLP